MAKLAIYGLMIASVTLLLAWVWGMVSAAWKPRRQVELRSQRRPTTIRRDPAKVSERSLR